MKRLSVNINKVATIRNSRGGNTPNVLQFAIDCEKFGAEGITVHPRPDERHIRYQDVRDLAPVVQTEFNIEGYPSRDFMDLVLAAQPAQVTLVPDPPHVLTSNAGWKIGETKSMLQEVISEFKEAGIRTSIFMETDLDNMALAGETGADRIELYTEDYARLYESDKETAIAPYVKAAKVAVQQGLEINAGHDLNLKNLKYFSENIPQLMEVSIGHALISDALYLGIENTIQLYLREFKGNMG